MIFPVHLLNHLFVKKLLFNCNCQIFFCCKCVYYIFMFELTEMNKKWENKNMDFYISLNFFGLFELLINIVFKHY